jgi:hypothetical protein
VYAPGPATLDAHNGRFGVTPEYPAGTYAYFATIDAAGDSAYPYLVGPRCRGDEAFDNFTQTVSIPAGAQPFLPCRGDPFADGLLNIRDYLAFLVLYADGSPSADFTGDGMVNVVDYLTFLILFSRGC